MKTVISTLFNKFKKLFRFENDTFWLITLLVTAFLGASLTIFGFDLKGKNFSTPLFYFTFVLLFVWLVNRCYIIIKNKKYEDLFPVCLLIFIFVIALFNILIQTPISAYSFDYFKKFILSGAVLCFIYLVGFGKFNPFLKNIFFIIGLVLSIEIIISFFSGTGQIYANQTSKDLLYFTFGNSNAAGINFGLLILINVCAFVYFKKWYLKVILVLITLCLLYLFYLTHARNAALSFLFCLFILLLVSSLSGKKKNKLSIKIVLSLACLSPILVSTIYTILITKTNALEVLNFFFGSTGKTLTSRELTWVAAFKHLEGFRFLFGDYYTSTTTAITLFDTLPGYQNSQIDFFVDFGLIPSFSILGFLIYGVLRSYKRIDTYFSRNFLPFICFFFTIFTSIFESGLFICMNVWYIFGFSFLALGNLFTTNKHLKIDEEDFIEVVI